MRLQNKNSGNKLSAFQWKNFWRELQHFRSVHGHCGVLVTDQNHPVLAQWVKAIRNRLDLLSIQQLTTLKNIHFDFGRRSNVWVSHFLELSEFKKCHGHGRVPMHYPKDPNLNGWMCGQRTKWDKMPIDKEKLLLRVGFDWRIKRIPTWERRLEQLREFKERYGHCDVPARWSENHGLSCWVSLQRVKYRRGRLSQSRRKLLEKLGFRWNPSQQIWELRYKELVQFKAKYGHCLVPTKWKPNTKLASWVMGLRVQHERLSPKRHAMLTKLGFVWSPNQSITERHLKDLEKFHKIHGHCRVPRKWKTNESLSYWLDGRRRRKAKLEPCVVNKLDAFGFVWNTRGAQQKDWLKRLEKIKEFKSRFGHAKVPVSWKEDRSLGKWLAHQKRRAKKGILRQDRRRLLVALGAL